MRVPLIGTLEANTAEVAAFPAMDSSARVQKTASDGVNTTMLRFDNVACIDSAGGRQEKVFDFCGPGKNEWEVTFTDSLIVFWHPMADTGFFRNKPKIKVGRATAGHLYYNSIGGLSAGYIDDDTPFFSCCCQRLDGVLSHILMFSDIDILQIAAKELHTRISAFLEKNGFSHSTDNIPAWESFLSNAWKQKQSDLRATVPFAQLQKVANNRI